MTKIPRKFRRQAKAKRVKQQKKEIDAFLANLREQMLRGDYSGLQGKQEEE